jgi:ParB/RepB/Spo0J family partition protein
MTTDLPGNISERRGLLDERLEQLRAEGEVRRTERYSEPRSVEGLHTRMHKRRNQRTDEAKVALYGPQGEERSKLVTRRCEQIAIDRIVIDPNFENSRLGCDREKFEQLRESMRHEGLKSAIFVAEAPGKENVFLLRAGFRRLAAARELGWKSIPACILPEDTPDVEEHWVHVIENSSRENLSTFELASLARKMREEFAIDAREFALRAGYSEMHIRKLLRCIDKLPEEIIAVWKRRAPLPLDYLAEWSALPPEEALAKFNQYVGKRPQPPQWISQPRKRRGSYRLLMATQAGLKRMSRLWSAIEQHSELDPKSKEHYLKIVGYCMGSRADVPGIYNPRSRRGTHRSRPEIDVCQPATPDEEEPGENGSGGS